MPVWSDERWIVTIGAMMVTLTIVLSKLNCTTKDPWIGFWASKTSFDGKKLSRDKGKGRGRSKGVFRGQKTFWGSSLVQFYLESTIYYERLSICPTIAATIAQKWFQTIINKYQQKHIDNHNKSQTILTSSTSCQSSQSQAMIKIW